MHVFENKDLILFLASKLNKGNIVKILKLNKYCFNTLCKSKIWCKNTIVLPKFVKKRISRFIYQNRLLSYVKYTDNYSIEFHVARLTNTGPKKIQLIIYIDATADELLGFYYYQKYICKCISNNWQDVYIQHEEIVELLQKIPIDILNICYIVNMDFSRIYFVYNKYKWNLLSLMLNKSRDNNNLLIYKLNMSVQDCDEAEIITNHPDFDYTRKIFLTIFQLL